MLTRFCLVLMGCALVAQPLFSETIKDKLILSRTMEHVKAYHYSPKTINDAFSKEVFETYLKKLDPNKQFLTQLDVEYLKTFETNIDDQVNIQSIEFQEKAAQVRRRRIQQVKSFYTDYLTTTLNFTTDESIITDTKKREYAKTPDDLKTLWRHIIKEQVLSQYVSTAKSDDEASANRKVFYPRIEKQARETVQKNLKHYFDNLLKETQEEELATYIDAITNIYDPHTGYYLPDKKEDFDISISGKLEGIGAVLKEEDGYIKVVRIVVGSAAYRQKQLKADDLILKVGQGSDPPTNIVGMRVRDAVKLIRGNKGTEVRLTVKKPDETVQVIPIIRDVVLIEDAYAKSTTVRHKESDIEMGYIYLPGFYRDFDDAKARNSADDVERAVRSLVEKDVKGIILDLRNNGGGSLRDAVDMAGLFIPQGPVVQVRDSHGSSRILKDTDSSVVYDGPLVVLVNAYSASASEILAAALQDYGRAVVVGSHTTYGKGTVQTFVNLDRSLPYPYQHYRPLGSVKLTIQKFYRINGGSTQFKGVTPDIILPFSTDYRDVGEKELPHALAWSTVKELNYSPWREPIAIQRLQKKSAKRVKKNPSFDLISEYSDYQKSKMDQDKRSLKFDKRINTVLKQEKLDKKYDVLEKVIPDIIVPTPSFSADKEEIERDKFKEWKANLTKDIYLNESIYILRDMVLGVK